MACIDERRSLINLNKESKKLEHETILGEPAENMNYNKSTIFFGGIISHNIKGYDGEDDIKNNYMVFGYENPIPYENIRKMFICNNEEKRTENGIQEKGMGIKHVFHKYSEQVEVLSIKGKIIETYFKVPLDRHINDLKNNKDINVNDNMLRLETSERNKKFGEIFNTYPHIKEIYQNMKNSIDKYNIDEDDGVKIPDSIIIIKLLDDYECSMEEIYNSINHIYSIKYIKKNKNKYYIFNNFKEDTIYDFKRIENNDLLMYDTRKDAFKFYIKHIGNKLIFYFKCQNKFYYYNFTSDGKSGLQELITCDHTLYNKVKHLDDNNEDFNLEIYRVDPDDYAIFKNGINLPEEHYTGFYFILDNTILNHTPSSLNDMIGKSVRNTGGTPSRYIIEIKNKSLFDLRGIKPEFSIKDQKQKQLIKFLWNVLWQSHNVKHWKKDYMPINKFIKPDMILIHFKTNCISRNRKTIIKVSKTKEGNATIKTLYLTLYNFNECEYKYLGKIGFCGEISKANDRNNKNIMKPIIYQMYINYLINSGAQEIENTIKNYLYNNDNIDIQEKGNNVTERFIFDDIKIYKKIEKKFIKTRDLLLNNNMDIKLCNQEINNIWETNNNNDQSDTII